MTYPNAIFSAAAFAGFLMCTIPLPWHLEAWNTGTCLYMIWTGLACLNQFINSVVWNRNAINWSPTWCDISSRFIVGSAVAIPAASLCINRRLYHISSVRSVTITKAEKRRDIIIDLAIGLGLPLLEMVLQYIPQGHRFNIFEDVGCYPFTYNTWPAFVLVYCPPIAIGLVSAVYAIMSIIQFNKSRSQFNDLLSGHNNLTSSRYVRLMCLAGIEVLCTVPLGSYALYLNIKAGINPWISWENTHFGFSRVDQIPSVLWRANRVNEISLELTRWLVIICACIFFGFFGFADEARKHYRSAYASFAKRVGISTGSFGNTNVFSSTGSKVVGTNGKIRPAPPMFVHRDMLRRQDSFDSLTDVSMSIADVSGHLDEKKVDEKEPAFVPTLSYGGLTLSDVGGTLADYKDGPYSPAPSSGSSSASTISVPEPALTRSNSLLSVPSTSSSPPQSPIEPSPKSNTHDITMDPTFPLFPIFALLSFILVLIPLPWHLQALNSGTCLFMIWTSIGCLNQFINSIVWHNNIVDWAPIWCDISTRLTVGIAVAIPAASLCINRRLYKIATCDNASITYAQKRRAVLVDLAIGLGIPAIQMALQFVVQGHRYDIWEDIGCLPTTVNTPPAYPLSFVWPNIISLISGCYCLLTLRAFMHRRAQFAQFLSSNTTLTVNRYFRLMCLATTEILFTIPLSSAGLYLNVISNPIYPWKSWSDIHFDWYVIDVIPAIAWRSIPISSAILELNRWSLVFCAFVFFAFFGFADEARRSYRRLFWSVAKRFGAIPPSNKKSSSYVLSFPILSASKLTVSRDKKVALPLKETSCTLPTFTKPDTTPSYVKRDSFHSSYSQASELVSDYTGTLYVSPNSEAKFDLLFPKSPDSSRLSRSTI
ncbi:hypothetical protein CVT26_005218 [Gymnopilus dilepis]|uniref:Uncharacterized protein n=1 Tax=Gymnopilus dilepis TaxID=231916 RepID=A0A409YVM6_9AGAR|nr:hypothetical protein CVT26_005218 [Gymnopilus dilepis]